MGNRAWVRRRPPSAYPQTDESWRLIDEDPTRRQEEVHRYRTVGQAPQEEGRLRWLDGGSEEVQEDSRMVVPEAQARESRLVPRREGRAGLVTLLLVAPHFTWLIREHERESSLAEVPG